jgi:hypothetical protein
MDIRNIKDISDIDDIKQKYARVRDFLSVLPNINYVSRRSVLETISNIIDLLLLRKNIFFMDKLKSILYAKKISVPNIHEAIVDIHRSNEWTEFDIYHLKILFVNMIIYIYFITNKNIHIKKYYDDIMERIIVYKNTLDEIIADYMFDKMIEDNTFYQMLKDDTFDDILLDNTFDDILYDNNLYQNFEPQYEENIKIKTFDEIFV